MGIIRMIVVAFIVGGLAQVCYPGAVYIGFILTVVLVISGSFIAGLVVQMLSPAQRSHPLHPACCIASILGAMVLIFIFSHFHLMGAYPRPAGGSAVARAGPLTHRIGSWIRRPTSQLRIWRSRTR